MRSFRPPVGVTEKASEPSSPADPVAASSFSSPPPRPPCLPVLMKRRQPGPWSFSKRTPPTLSESSTTPHSSPTTMPLSLPWERAARRAGPSRTRGRCWTSSRSRNFSASSTRRDRVWSLVMGTPQAFSRQSINASSFRSTIDALLQRYTVNLYPAWVGKLQSQLKPVIDHEGAPLEYVGNYDQDVGLRLGELPPERFVA